MEYILIFITAIFVNNIVLSQFLGICPFLGVSKKVETAMGMGAAVAFVLTLATIVTYVIQKFVLDAFGLSRVTMKRKRLRALNGLGLKTSSSLLLLLPMENLTTEFLPLGLWKKIDI